MVRTGKATLVIIVVSGILLFPFVALSGDLKSLTVESGDIYCVSCALTVKKAISPIEGIKKVEVSAGTKKIYVEYDEGKVTEGQIIKAIRGLGFRIDKVK